MDDGRFDSLTRAFAGKRTRRGLLAIASAAGIGLAPFSTRAAPRLRALGVVCGKNADCESAFCAEKDRTGRRLCAPADPCSGVSGGEGEFFCAGTGFCKIDHGVGVYFDCSPGLPCLQIAPGQIVCTNDSQAPE